jgi:ubiquinone/menaquinone biosynthesis C-methylase UbiE
LKSFESYTLGYHASAVGFMTRRDAETHAGFVLPYLQPGFRVLDCGCGPGTITLDFALRAAPGEVIGIDREESQLAMARSAARDRHLYNARFQAASVYELPFENAGFDLVFAHALFEHLREPARALDEIRRVLKPGGLVALRSPDWGGFLFAPETAARREAIDTYKCIQSKNGGNVNVGRDLKSLLLKAGFSIRMTDANYECLEPVSIITDLLAGKLAGESGTPESLVEALRDWPSDPAAFFAIAWCEAVGEIPSVRAPSFIE